MANRLHLCTFGLLLLLLIPSSNSMIEIENQIQTDPQSSTDEKLENVPVKKSVRWQQQESPAADTTPKKPEDHSIEKKVTQAELVAVDGNISAVYIIRVINKRAEALKILKAETMAEIPDLATINEEFNNVNKSEEKMEDAQKTLKKTKGKKKEGKTMREIYAEMWSKSNLSNADMKTLTSGLAGALNSGSNMKEYLKTVKGRISKFQTEMPEPNSSCMHKLGKLATKVVNTLLCRRQNADLYNKLVEKCKKLRQEHLDFLKQIQLEVELNYAFNKPKEIIKFNTIKDHLKNKAAYKDLMDLNKATKDVYIDITKLVPLKIGSNFVMSLRSIAKSAKLKGENEHIEGEDFLTHLFKIAAAVTSIFQQHTSIGRKTTHEKIREKLEMPMDLFGRMRDRANPSASGLTVTDEQRWTAEVEMMLAKTLLVYERLNKFYKIDDLRLPKNRKSLKKEKKVKQTAVAASPAAGK